MLKLSASGTYLTFSIEGKSANDVKNEVHRATYQKGFRTRLVLRHGIHCVEGICGESDKAVDQIIALIHGVASQPQ
jgi:hypothetical protein